MIERAIFLAAAAGLCYAVASTGHLLHDIRLVHINSLSSRGLRYSDNDTVVFLDIEPALLRPEPSVVRDVSLGVSFVAGCIEISSSEQHQYNSTAASDSTRYVVQSGPLLGASRIVERCAADSSSGAGAWRAAAEHEAQFCTSWLYVDAHLRIPACTLHKYVLDSQYDAAHPFVASKVPPAASSFEKGDAAEAARRAAAVFAPGAAFASYSAITTTHSTVLSATAESAGQRYGDCTPGSLRVTLSEWRLPSRTFGVLARLALADPADPLAAAAPREHVSAHAGISSQQCSSGGSSCDSSSSSESFAVNVGNFSDYSGPLLFTLTHWWPAFELDDGLSPPLSSYIQYSTWKEDYGKAGRPMPYSAAPWRITELVQSACGEAWRISLFMLLGYSTVLLNAMQSCWHDRSVQRRKQQQKKLQGGR